MLFVGLDIYEGVGGIQRYCQQIAQCLDGLTDSTVITLRGRSGSAAIYQPARRYIACSSNKLKLIAVYLWCAWHSRPTLIMYGHILLIPLMLLGRLVCPRAKHVLFVYGVDAWGPPVRRIRFWEPWFVRSVDRVIAISRFTAARMRAAYSLCNVEFSILPCATPLKLAGPSMVRQRAGTGPRRCLTVARLGKSDRAKGCDQVIRALPAVLKRHPDLQYDIVGDGPLRSELRELAQQLGVAEHIRFLGYLADDQLRQVYQEASLFVLPSSKEGFGIVFLEAWANGLPVIAGNVDASAEVVTPGVDGILVDPTSAKAISQAILTLLDRPDLADNLARNGYRTVQERYTFDNFRQTFEAIVRDLEEI